MNTELTVEKSALIDTISAAVNYLELCELREEVLKAQYNELAQPILKEMNATDEDEGTAVENYKDAWTMAPAEYKTFCARFHAAAKAAGLEERGENYSFDSIAEEARKNAEQEIIVILEKIVGEDLSKLSYHNKKAFINKARAMAGKVADIRAKK